LETALSAVRLPVYENPDGTFAPPLCTDYKFSDDGTEITFTVREGVKFHNGDTMTWTTWFSR
jgi:ABC-type transport system substrate-binding protein